MDAKWGIELVGQLLDGRYRVAGILGRGEHGVFYLAEDQRVQGRQITVKIPDPELAATSGFLERWLEEIERISQLEHPRVLKLLGGGLLGEVPYVLAEHLPNGTLQQRIQGGLLTPQQVLSWLPDIAEALDYMHSEGVAHGDLKPENIFFDALDHAYVADFGIAKAAGLASIEGGAEEDRRRLAGIVFEVLFGQQPEEQVELSSFLSQALPGFNAVAQALARALGSGARRETYPTCKRFADALGAGLLALPLPPKPLSNLKTPVAGERLPSKRSAPTAAATPRKEAVTEGHTEDFHLTAPARSRAPAVLAVVAVVLALAAVGAYKGGWIGKIDPASLPTPMPTPRPTLLPLELKSQTIELPGKVPLELLWVPGGVFQMGCSEEDTECEIDEKPMHPVEVGGFWMSKSEITQKQWMAVQKSNPSAVQGDTLPVTNVSWVDAQSFVKKAGNGLRLPTEAEWEKAARQGFYGPRYGELDSIAWYAANSGGKPQAVGQKQGNPLGLMDMLGNVREWCLDGYKLDAYKQARDANNPVEANAEASPTQPRVIRGGAWDQDGRQSRVSFRLGLPPQTMSGNLGFRVAHNP